ncbi:SKP1-like protein 11 [Actinidia eriantha]|uniref:SKP1-like protein 11 n=1 Tax=Actinidia eriantha TaxID=165200 RepID=UPI00258AEB31|nr:SKP1-like protein 11 [Actinidia eriantha]
MASAPENEKNASAPEKKTLTLKSMINNEEFVVDEHVALQSVTIKNMVDSDCAGEVIPVPTISGEILALVIEYCKNHANPSASEDDLKKADAGFVDKDIYTLIDLVLAANFLDIKGLLEVTSQKIADSIKDLPHQDVREIFQVENDYTPEEEAAVRAEHDWAFEGFP